MSRKEMIELILKLQNVDTPVAAKFVAAASSEK